jgi:hypothetical protein
MARQYFQNPLVDTLITAQAAVSPGTTTTSIFAINQSNKFLALPNGQNSPSPGQMFKIVCGGLVTTPASGTLQMNAYHGPGTTTTAFGTLIATSPTFTPTASITAGYWRIEGDLMYRTISEIATTSTVWFSGNFAICGPSGGALARVDTIISSNAAVSVDTTGTGSAGTFGAVNFSVAPSVTGSTWTPQFAYILSVN